MTVTGQTGHPTPAPAQLRRREKKDRAIAALREHGTLEMAATVAKVSRSTLYRWRAADPAFEAEVKQWMDEDMEDELHDTLFTIAKLGMTDAKYANAAVRAAELLIKAENRAKYGDHQTIDQTVNVNHIVQLSHDARQAIQQRQAEKLKELRTIDVEATP